MPLAGEAKKEYQRIYMRSRTKSMQAAALAVKKMIQGKDLQALERESATAAFIQALRSKGLDINVIAAKVVEKLESQRTIVVKGVATEIDDNDAQLRATDIGIKLLERAGIVPSASEGPVSGSITVNVLMLNAEQAEPQTQDLTVDNES